MQRVYTIKLSILGAQGAHEGIVQDGVIEEMESWLREKFVHVLPEDQLESFKLEYNKPYEVGEWTLKANRMSGKAGKLFEYELVHPDESRADVLWRTYIRVSYDALNDITEVHLELLSGYSIDTMDMFVGDPRPPRIIKRLIERFQCTSFGSVASVQPHIIEEGKEGDFVDDVLLDPNRRIPCILVTTKSVTDLPVVDPYELARDLAGLAIVALLPMSYQTYAITEITGKEFSCFHGGVRLYRPNFSFDDDPYLHPLFIGNTIEKNKWGFCIKLRRTVYDMASSGISKGSVYETVSKKIRKEIAEKTQGTKNIDQLKRHLWEKDEEIVDLKDRLDTANGLVDQLGKRVGELQVLLATANAKLDTSNVIEAPNEATISLLHTAGEVIEFAEGTLERLTFHQKSKDGGKGYRTTHNDELYKCLIALDTLAAEYFDNGCRLGMSLEEWLKNYFISRGVPPIKFAPSESQTTMGKYGQERTVSLKDRKIMMQKHFTIGTGDREGCLHVFWEFDNDSKTILVGHVGKHLRYDRGEN